MTALMDAYERRDVKDEERIISDHHYTFLQDTFVQQFIPDVIKELRVQYILNYIRPYRSVRLDRLASVCVETLTLEDAGHPNR